MASGLPVVASRIGGIAELVDNGNSGWLFEHGDAEELAERLRYYIDAPEQIAAHGQKGRERIQAYAFGLQIERIEALLASAGPERGESPQLIACHGAPLESTFNTVLKELAPIPANRPQPASQPCWIPVNWIKPEQADLLWVSGPVTGDPVKAMQHIEAFRSLNKQVVLDERNISVARKTDDSQSRSACSGLIQLTGIQHGWLAGCGRFAGIGASSLSTVLKVLSSGAPWQAISCGDSPRSGPAEANRASMRSICKPKA